MDEHTVWILTRPTLSEMWLSATQPNLEQMETHDNLLPIARNNLIFDGSVPSRVRYLGENDK